MYVYIAICFGNKKHSTSPIWQTWGCLFYVIWVKASCSLTFFKDGFTNSSREWYLHMHILIWMLDFIYNNISLPKLLYQPFSLANSVILLVYLTTLMFLWKAEARAECIGKHAKNAFFLCKTSHMWLRRRSKRITISLKSV